MVKTPKHYQSLATELDLLWLLVYSCHSWVMLILAPDIDGWGGGEVKNNAVGYNSIIKA